MKRAALAALVLLGVACDPPPASNAPSASEPPIAAKWRARCGNCHVRVEPGTRSRAALEAALARHHRRVHLTDEQWSQMITFLANDATPPPAPPQDHETIEPRQAPVPPIPPPEADAPDGG